LEGYEMSERTVVRLVDSEGSVEGELQGNGAGAALVALASANITALATALQDLSVTLATLLSGEDQENNRLLTMGEWTLTPIDAGANDEYTTGGPAILHGFEVTAAGTGTTSTLKLYDGSAATGRLLKTWTVPAAGPYLLGLDGSFETSLTIVTEDGDGAAPGVMVAASAALAAI
jgi:hypothetical protein